MTNDNLGEKKATAISTKPSSNTLNDFAIRTGMIFVAVIAGGMVVLTVVGVRRNSDTLGKLLGIGLTSSPLLGFVSEVWKTKKSGEQFIASRKKEVDEQFSKTKEEFNSKLNSLELLIKEHINQPGHKPLEDRVTAIEISIARLKAEVKTATQTGRLRDELDSIKSEMRSKLSDLEGKIK